MKHNKVFLTLALLVAFMAACAPQVATQPAIDETASQPAADNVEAQPAVDDAETQSAPLNITVSILPEKFLVDRIGGSFVNVNAMVVSGADPHTYEPKPEQMRELTHSVAYFTIGIEYEDTWLDRIQAANPDMQIVNITDGIERIPMVAHHHHHEGGEEHEGEEHEGEEHEEEGGLDPHTWTSPKLVKIMANKIYDELVKLDPDHQKDFEQNLQALNLDIDQLDESIKTTLNGVTNRSFIVFHPSWGYFANDYNLNQISIEIEGQEPSPQEMATIIDEAKEENCKVIFGQPGFSTKTADTIAQEIGGKVLLINPLEENWLENMQLVANTFAEALK